MSAPLMDFGQAVSDFTRVHGPVLFVAVPGGIRAWRVGAGAETVGIQGTAPREALRALIILVQGGRVDETTTGGAS